MALASYAYGSVVGVATQARRFTNAALTFDDNTFPTYEQVETWINEVSALVNTMLNTHNITTPITDAELVVMLGSFINSEVAAMVNGVNGAGRLGPSSKTVQQVGMYAAIQYDVQTFIDHGQPIYSNPSAGNREGGITTLEEKSLGCIQKGGSQPVVDVLGYGQQVRKPGLSLAEGPGNDLISVSVLAAAGAAMILFTTGRGTPLGAPVPVVKIASNSELAARKPRWIDFDAGALITGASPEQEADRLLQVVVDVASGGRTKNEENGYHDFLPFKDGTTQ